MDVKTLEAIPEQLSRDPVEALRIMAYDNYTVFQELHGARNIATLRGFELILVKYYFAVGQFHNLFRLGRHLLRAKNYRTFRSRAFGTRSAVTCA